GDVARAGELDVILADPGVDMPGIDIVQPPDGADAAAAQLVTAINEHPLAAAALVMLLRGAANRSVIDGLVAESTPYSMLQARPDPANRARASAARLVADPDTALALPAVGMGVMPGAGGPVSRPRRIGRRRTAYLALSGVRLDATTACAWGLVDEVAASRP